MTAMVFNRNDLLSRLMGDPESWLGDVSKAS
jgi:hypothetical protein